MTFEHPFVLFGLLLVPLWAWAAARPGRPRLAFPAGDLARAVAPSRRRRFVFVPNVLRGLAAALVVVAIARPMSGTDVIAARAEGIDIQLVLDVSASMRRTDIDRSKSRIEVAVEVIDRFVQGREQDRIGLITFFRYPRVVCPLTLDKNALRGFLADVRAFDSSSEEKYTAIGVALAAAVLKLKDETDRTRVVVLLTDGEERVHDVEPIEAADLARAHGIKVYAIALASRVGRFAEELKELGRRTGADGFVATDQDTLANVYDLIDALERHEVEEKTLTRWKDVYPSILAAGLALLVLELVLDLFLFRRYP